jgi:TRAP-type mannitol/chloroaromatic compound transport system permease small subunit
VLYDRWGLKTKAWIEFLGILLLLLPFLGVVIYHMAPYAYESYIADERSQVIAGLTNRWIMKYIVLIAMILLAVAAFSRLLKCSALLFGFPKPRRKA